MTLRLVVDPHAPDPEAIARAAAAIRRGELVAIPTETVYGLAANALDPAAVAGIYAAKGRPSFNPLIVHVADVADLSVVAAEIPPLALTLAERFWPGPLTMVLPRTPAVPDIVTGGGDTVGIRIPAHPVARAVIRAAGVPLAAPSANPFMRVSPTTADHVVEGLADRVAIVLDAGPTTVGIESTVVDLTQTPPRLLRPGGLPRAALEAMTGPLAAPAPASAHDAVRPAPGMIARHYAPRVPLELFSPATLPQTLAAARAAHESGARVAVVSWSAAPSDEAFLHLMPRDPAAFATQLYAMLHFLDAMQLTRAWIERPPEEPGWEAVTDRLTRATSA